MEKMNGSDITISSSTTGLQLNKIAVVLFTVSFMTVAAFFSSNGVKVGLLYLSVILLVADVLLKKGTIHLKKIDLALLIFLFVLTSNIFLFSRITNLIIFDMLVFFGATLFIIFNKLEVSDFKLPFKIILFAGLFYALGSILQYISPGIYNSFILPLFTNTERGLVLRQLSNGIYPGFTFQVSNTAGYITFALGILVFTMNKKRKLWTLLIIAISSILIFGLLLTGKRAHILFMILAYLFTYLFSERNKQMLIRLLKVSTVIIVLVISLLLALKIYEGNPDLPFYGFMERVEDTIDGLKEDRDITSGRSALYDFSMSVFRENPIFGGGWWTVRDNSIGIINDEKGSHPHNIYLQLLSELGIVGLLSFAIILLFVLLSTLKLLKVDYVINSREIKQIVQISLYFQVFYMLYGITGNVLTDHNFLLSYFFALILNISVYRSYRKKKYVG